VIAGGALLLKDEKNILPLGANVKSIAIIGTQTTNQAIVVEQGSPYVKPLHLAPVFDAVNRARDRTALRMAFSRLRAAK
jgi:beta-glucosidase